MESLKNLIRKREKELIVEKDVEPKDEVNKIFDVFFDSINPNINYANITNRKAVKFMIKKFGLEKVINTAKYAISVQGKKFAPTITTPYQLKEKMSALIIYYKRELEDKKIKTL